MMQSPVSASKCLLVTTQGEKNPRGPQQDTHRQSPVGVCDKWLVAQPKCPQLWSTSPGAPPTTTALKSTLPSSLDLLPVTCYLCPLHFIHLFLPIKPLFDLVPGDPRCCPPRSHLGSVVSVLSALAPPEHRAKASDSLEASPRPPPPCPGLTHPDILKS